MSPASVRPDPGCSRDLLWRIDLPAGGEPQAYAKGLSACDLTLDRAVGGVLFFSHPEGHQVVVVPRTGRAQLRLDGLVPHEARRPLAATLGAAIARALPRPAPSGR